MSMIEEWMQSLKLGQWAMEMCRSVFSILAPPIPSIKSIPLWSGWKMLNSAH